MAGLPWNRSSRIHITPARALLILWMGMLATVFPLHGQTDKSDAETVRQQLEKVEELRNAGAYEEGRSLVDKAADAATALEIPSLEVEALYQSALLHYFTNDYQTARNELEIALARARVHELETQEADILNAAGVLEWKQGNLTLALPKLESAMLIQERRGNSISMASISNNLGIISYSLKRYGQAEQHYRKGLVLLEEKEHDGLKASLYSNLAEVLIPQDRLDEAEEYLQKALAIEEVMKEPHSLAYTYFNLGELYSKKGDSEKAVGLYMDALRLQLEIDEQWAVALTRLRLGKEYFLIKQEKAALEELAKGHELAMNLNALSLLRDYAALFSEIYISQGKTARAQYHQQQEDWLTQRIELGNEPGNADNSDYLVVERTPKITFSTIQNSVIVLLGVIIIVLIIENARLRHHRKP